MVKGIIDYFSPVPIPVIPNTPLAGSARLRYLRMVVLFVTLSLVLNYWNLLGWKC